MSNPLFKSSKAIIHFDGDAFFASVAQAKDWRLRGKPVVMGGERYIATAFSYEAKARGVCRGMNLKEIRRVCPEAIVLPSDYLAYSIFARRMYNIARKFTPNVEEYSIDECFADITGLDRELGMSYEEVAKAIKKDLEMKLGITFGVGLAPNKVLAKIASKHRKPAGFTVITTDSAKEFLSGLPIEKIWGIGPSISTYLRQKGIVSAQNFADKPMKWLEDNKIAKPYKEIWYELRGHFVKEVHSEKTDMAGSIMKTRTFTPATSNRHYIFSQLSHNIEEACLRARAQGIASRGISFFLKTQEFRYHRIELDLPVATNHPTDIIAEVAKYFDNIYRSEVLFRASGITLRGLIPVGQSTPDLFGQKDISSKSDMIFETIDSLNKRFGRSTVFLSSSLASNDRKESVRGKDAVYTNLELPYLGKVK